MTRLFAFFCATILAAQPARTIVLHAARLIDVETGAIAAPGEVLVQGDRIADAGSNRQITQPERRSSIWATPLCCPA